MYFFKKAKNKYMFVHIDWYKYSKSHHLLGNNHTGAPELKERTDVASQFISKCCNLCLCVLFPLFQSDEMHTDICYIPSFTRECGVCLMGGFFLCMWKPLRLRGPKQ
jgi:hypothetical protein